MCKLTQIGSCVAMVLLCLAFASSVHAQDLPPHDFWWGHGIDDGMADNVESVDFTADGDVVFGGWSRVTTPMGCTAPTEAFIGRYLQDGTTDPQTAAFFEPASDFLNAYLNEYAFRTRTNDVAVWDDEGDEFLFAVGAAELRWSDTQPEPATQRVATVTWILKFDLQNETVEALEIIGRTASEDFTCLATNVETDFANVEGLGIDVSDAGEVIVTGWFATKGSLPEYGIQFVGSTKEQSQSETKDIFVLHLDADDLTRLAVSIPQATGQATAGHDQGSDVVFDSDGRFAVTGDYDSEDLDFGDTSAADLTNSDETLDFFLAAYEIDGLGGIDFLDAEGSEGDNIAESGQGVATSTIGGVVSYYVGGYFSGTIFSNLESMQSAGDFDMLLVAYDWDDTNDVFDGPIWYTQEGGTGDDKAYGIAFTCDEEVQIAGQFDDGSDLNVFVGSYDPSNGGEIWTEEVTSAPDDDIAWDIAAGPIGDSATVGQIGDDAVFEAYAGVDHDVEVEVASMEGPDGFVTRVVNSELIDDVDPTGLDIDPFRLRDNVRESVAAEDTPSGWITTVDVYFQLHPDCLPDDITDFRVMVESRCLDATVTRTVQVRDHDGAGSWVTLNAVSVGSGDVLSIATFTTAPAGENPVTTPVDASDQVTIRVIHEHTSSFTARHDWVRLETLEH